ncbi:MAG: MaoC/PaaZ C-terminal domain-containing protein [Gammaproteobacteria bacterium]
MAFTYDRLMSYDVPQAEQMLAPHDCILYALSVGLGADPLNAAELRYVYERDLVMAPMQSNVLAYPGFWAKAPETGIDWRRVLHAEQRLTLHAPLPVEGKLVGRTYIDGIRDRGKDRGAFVYVRREVTHDASGEHLCTLEQNTLARGDGGCGGDDAPPYTPHPLPERSPDEICDLPIPLNAALVYRLNGDLNPLHVDPEIARAAGFDRPILHGLCTFGYAGHALLETVCDYRPDGLESMAVRFTAPVYPGETLRTQMWLDGNEVSFRSLVIERDVVVLGNGLATLA